MQYNKYNQQYVSAWRIPWPNTHSKINSIKIRVSGKANTIIMAIWVSMNALFLFRQLMTIILYPGGERCPHERRQLKKHPEA